jgi:nucleotide-binding universal stress UspA family protein
MLKKVLVATDGSEKSGKAIAFAARLFDNTDCHITLMIVIEKPIYPVMHEDITPPLETLPPYEDLVEGIMNQADKVLLKNETPLTEAGLEVEQKVRFGNPAAEILQEIEEGDYEMIVVGSHGHGALGELVLGSVSYRISHHAKCPVLIVH